MKKIIKNKDLQKKILIFFLILQPFLDCYILYTNKVINFFGFSPTTIIRLLFIFLMTIWIFFTSDNKKSKIILFIYGVLVCIYTILHCFFAMNLNIVNFSNFNFSLINELLYIIRMLLPIGLVYITYEMKFTKDEFIKVINWTLFTICSIIIISNLFKVSLKSYSDGVIEGNILDWFFSKGKYDVVALASKGWFNSANQISGLIMLLFMFSCYSLFDKFTIKRSILILLAVITMIMIGTRTSSYGWILIIVAITLLNLFMVIIKKEKFNFRPYICVGLFLILGGILVANAPVVSSVMIETYTQSDNEANKNIEELVKESELLKSSQEDEKKIEQAIENNDCLNKDLSLDTKCLVRMLAINPVYYRRIFKIEEHMDFWEKFIFEIPAEQKYGNRNLQLLLTKDIDENYKTSTTSYFGYGYTRFIDAYLYLEHDGYVHYYTIGILGIILFVLPYLLISIVSAILILIRKKISFLNLTLIGSIIMILGIAYITGHIVDELIISLFIGFISGFLLHSIGGEKNEKN